MFASNVFNISFCLCFIQIIFVKRHNSTKLIIREIWEVVFRLRFLRFFRFDFQILVIWGICEKKKQKENYE